jgi:hypothetical protein
VERVIHQGRISFWDRLIGGGGSHEQSHGTAIDALFDKLLGASEGR